MGRSGSVMLLVFLAVIVFAFVAGFFWMRQAWLSAPQQVVANAFAKMATLKNVEYQLTENVTTNAGATMNQILQNLVSADPRFANVFNRFPDSIRSTSTYVIKEDWSDPENSSYDVAMKLDASFPAGSSISTEEITTGNDLYTTTYQGDTLQASPGSTGQWVKSARPSAPVVLIDYFIQSNQAAASFRKDVLGGKFFNSVARENDEAVNGIETTHYVVQLANPAATYFFKNLPEGAAVSSSTFSDLDLWIGKTDQIIYRADLTVTVGGSQHQTQTMVYTFTLTNFNQPVVINPPSDWVPSSQASSLGLNVSSSPSATSAGEGLISFASCIAASGAKFYGAFWCSHCQAQKAMFGSAAGLLPYVECSTSDGSQETQVCLDKNISAYPTWYFRDGSSMVGTLPLATLSQKTGCSLPSGIQ